MFDSTISYNKTEDEFNIKCNFSNKLEVKDDELKEKINRLNSNSKFLLNLNATFIKELNNTLQSTFRDSINKEYRILCNDEK